MSIKRVRDVPLPNDSLPLKRSTSPNTKMCRICGEFKAISTEFHKCSSERVINGKVYPTVYRSECKSCRRVGGRAHSSAAKKLMQSLNMKRPPIGTPCENCNKSTEKLIFDHDHDTNEFRGWLCYQCNTAIGNLGDTIEGLKRAIRYLEKNNSVAPTDSRRVEGATRT